MNRPRFVAQFRVCLSLLACLIQGSGMAAGGASADQLFQEGFQTYAAGGYEQAATLFREAAVPMAAAGVWHNLGNADWKCGRIGPALLAWERARWIDPYNANTRANLRYARHVAQLDAPDLAWYEICSTWLPVNAWAWIAGLSFWTALAMVLLPGVWRWRKADWHQALAAAGLAVFLLTIPALLGVHTRSHLGVVLAKDTPLRLTPTRNAETLVRLLPGEMARTERRRGDYYYIRTDTDAAGWIERAQFELICRR